MVRETERMKREEKRNEVSVVRWLCKVYYQIDKGQPNR